MIRSELQSERDALQSELSEATDANRELSANLDAANAALQQMKADMEGRLMAAEEELENTRYGATTTGNPAVQPTKLVADHMRYIQQIGIGLVLTLYPDTNPLL